MWSGQMLIEIVVAVGIIALVLVGVSDLMTRSARVTTFQRQKDEAFTISQRLLNDYRFQRDSNPQVFYDSAVGTILDPCVSGKTYVCTVSMVKTLEAVLVTVKVEWGDGGQTFNISLSQSLSREIK
ncbi:MAG: hypothetical protein UX47_C0003G0041 [Candidatus Collierbacteria bacterium GW2011_GWA2_46_26]|uniref:Uncharacterized protein n=1 Tax=Candidatus Collierbacteria bacterium GW2011_GWA2_46_26 TaxID=1618381 RepID=A0A0G1RU53_9BACT|nr:MAG: hypothetical protein UW29_C0002G0041 [Candidatus Collierbacteria bacterium GW2011_GWC2_44_13]KKU33518.1 MAG: hypothetical protein UX47_C0003G0041 [Candidatus Collierbacteria bacterium GW2011_GWA2_46_26]